MKKYIAILITIILMTIFIKVPKYVELNNLILVDGIGVSCRNESYTLFIKEIIPTKKETGIIYSYKIYEDTNSNINKAYKNIEKKVNKKIYSKEARYIITDCDKSDKIIKYFNINPKYIKHTKKNIAKEIK